MPPCRPQGFELVFYGDSITETWRGTDLGKPCKRPGCKEGPDIFRQHFGDRWRTGVLGVAGRCSTSSVLQRGMHATARALHVPSSTGCCHVGQHFPTLLGPFLDRTVAACCPAPDLGCRRHTADLC